MQKAVFVHSGQSIRCSRVIPGKYIYTIEEKPITREEAENNMVDREKFDQEPEKTFEEQVA